MRPLAPPIRAVQYQSQRLASDFRPPVEVAAIALSVALLWLRHVQMPLLVTGVDGGDWLALAAELIGVHSKGAQTAYPPLFPALTVTAGLGLSPLAAIRISGLATSIAPGVGAYCLARGLGLRWAALIGFVAAGYGYFLEMLAWGGYPQLLGTGVICCALAAMAMAMRESSRLFSAAAGALGGLAILCQELVGLQAVVGLTVLSVIWAMTTRPRPRTFFMLVWPAILAGAVFAAPGIPAYLTLLRGAGGSDVLNTQGYEGLAAMLAYLSNEAPYAWAAIACLTLCCVGAMVWKRDWLILAVVAALLVSSFGLGIASREIRFMAMGELVPLVAGGWALASVIRRGRGTRAAVAILVLALGLSAVWTGQQRFDRAMQFYSVLDPYVADGLSWLRVHVKADDLAASAPAPRDWPLGWWVEGLAGVPTYVETDARWLFFREEQAQSRIAREILSNSDPRLAAAAAQQYGVTLLIIDGRDNGRADQWIRSGRLNSSINVAYRNHSLTIFRVQRTPS